MPWINGQKLPRINPYAGSGTPHPSEKYFRRIGMLVWATTELEQSVRELVHQWSTRLPARVGAAADRPIDELARALLDEVDCATDEATATFLATSSNALRRVAEVRAELAAGRPRDFGARRKLTRGLPGTSGEPMGNAWMGSAMVEMSRLSYDCLLATAKLTG